MTTQKRRVWVVVRTLLIVATFAAVAIAVSRQWSEVRAVAEESSVSWDWVILATVIVLSTYALLIQCWRLLLGPARSELPFGAAMRIWTIANLGRYVPGKVWQIGAMGMLARQQGISALRATTAALVGTALNIGAGFVVLAFGGGQALAAIDARLQTAAWIVSVVFLTGAVLLPKYLPAILRLAMRWIKEPVVADVAPPRELWAAVAMNAASWVLYGLAFAAFARGVAPSMVADPVIYIVIWTGSYLFGYLLLYLPGGIGAREIAMTGAFVALGLASSAEAAWLAASSRLWLTVCEVLPGCIALVLRPRRKSPPD